MDSSRKRILILSDNDGLSRAIELNLSDCSDADIVRVTGRSLGRQERQAIGDPCLIIVATSSPASEPVVALARASLGRWIGQVPLLIISDRPFQRDPICRVVHLSFPFSVKQIQDAVRGILHGQLEPIRANVDRLR